MNIGQYSGKIKAGVYRCGSYVIERQLSDYWWIKKDEKFVEQYSTYQDAYYDARYGKHRED